MAGINLWAGPRGAGKADDHELNGKNNKDKKVATSCTRGTDGKRQPQNGNRETGVSIHPCGEQG